MKKALLLIACEDGTLILNPLPNGKLLDWFKLKAFADYKIYITEKLKFVLKRVKTHCGKRRKC